MNKIDNFRERVRKQPIKTLTNDRIIRRVFGEEYTLELAIPSIINNYNHYIRSINLSNQYRELYQTY